ncbi:sentrin-specific protease 7-like [Menidia menidia]
MTLVRGYGVWDGGVAKGGSLLSGWEGPAPSLLFLWVSQAQSRLLQRELHQACSAPAKADRVGRPRPLAALPLGVRGPEPPAAEGAAPGLQRPRSRLLLCPDPSEGAAPGAAGRPAGLHFGHGGVPPGPGLPPPPLLPPHLPPPPLLPPHLPPGRGGGPPPPWAGPTGCCWSTAAPPPVDRHLLRLLGRSPSLQLSVQQKSVRQQLPSRLFQYPPAPCRGRISVTREDLACLETGEFLNDVIIDFYLKYLLLEGAAGPVAQRSHVFSSFFFRQLSRRRAPGEDPPSVPDRLVRHRRVKNWTRNQDIFTKDFLFVPVNREAHWFLVVICFPGLEGIQHEDFQSPAGAAAPPKTPPPPDCTEQGCRRNRVMKRPCILVLDSLKLSNHESVCNLLRDYLQVEWEERRGRPLPPDKPRPLEDKPLPPDEPRPLEDKPRPFLASSFSSSSCRVPQQDNSSDCGLFLLQNAESFLQNPVVHFELPPRLERWFPRRRAQQKREEIRRLIRRLQREEASPR